MVVGFAVNVTATLETVTVVLADAVPPRPWAVAVKVVVCVMGPTTPLPCTGTAPMR